jgi:uncharacterized protein YndB with AHSA1/START domain
MLLTQEAMTMAIATAEVSIAASISAVWKGLTDPELIKRYMFGSEVVTDWQPGSQILWRGEYEGQAYEDKGVVLDFTPESRIQVTYYSPMLGLPDEPENYHTITYELASSGAVTTVRLSQDGASDDEEAERFSANWKQALDGLKSVVES